MKEIQYRVWDKEENKYFEPIYEAHNGKLLDISIGLNGRLLRRTLQFPAEDESMFEGRYEVELFIGQKDKNGKKIFEGDIYLEKGLYRKHIGGELIPTQHPRVVKFEEIENDFGTTTYGYMFYTYDSAKDVEIIGNIHENPELL